MQVTGSRPSGLNQRRPNYRQRRQLASQVPPARQSISSSKGTSAGRYACGVSDESGLSGEDFENSRRGLYRSATVNRPSPADSSPPMIAFSAMTCPPYLGLHRRLGRRNVLAGDISKGFQRGLVADDQGRSLYLYDLPLPEFGDQPCHRLARTPDHLSQFLVREIQF